MIMHRLALAAATIVAAGIFAPIASARTVSGPAPVIPELDRLHANPRVSLDFENAPAGKVLEELAAAGSIHLSVDGPGDCCLVSVSLKNVTIAQALEAVAAQTELHFHVVDSYSLRATLPEPAEPAEGDGIVLPQIVTRIEPAYPKDAIEARVEGDVVLRAVVREDGTVGGVTVLSAVPGWPSIDRNAFLALQQWTFRPAVKDGRPVSVYNTIKMEFRLKDAASD